jgi:hypothetical protein
METKKSRNRAGLADQMPGILRCLACQSKLCVTLKPISVAGPRMPCEGFENSEKSEVYRCAE